MQTNVLVQAVFFDAAGTLFHLPKGVAWHYCDVAARLGCELSRGSVEDAFRAAWKEAPSLPETRRGRVDDGRDWWRAIVWRILDRCAADAEFDRERYFTELYAEFARPGIWELFPEVSSVLESLAPRFRLGVISNFDGRLRAVLRHLRIAHFFQHCVISSEVGADKPSSWIFKQALAEVGLPASAVLHVGDDPDCDWLGAASAGFQVFRLERPQNNLLDLLTELS